MANFVLCSEQVLGREKLHDLGACALELVAQGHLVSLVCADLQDAHSNANLDQVRIFRAPDSSEYGSELSSKQLRPSNLSELLRLRAFSSKQVLTPILRAWHDLLLGLGADYVICDQAPTALIVSRILSIPSVMIGDGFKVPPKLDPLPNFRPWRSEAKKREKDLKRSRVDDKRLIGTINESLLELGFEKAQLSSVMELYSHATQWLMTVPEMDHFGRRDLAYVVRWPSSKSFADAVWPEHTGEKVFVVFSRESSHCKAVLRQLAELDMPTLAVVKNANANFVKRFENERIKIQLDMVNLRSVSQQCKIIFCDSDHDLVYELLSLGVPSVLLPRGISDTLLTYRLAKKRLGFAGPSKSSNIDVSKLISSTKNNDQVWHNASRFSLKYATHTSLLRLRDLIQELCSPVG